MAPIACSNDSVTWSLATGPPYVSRVVGLAEPPTAANAPPVPPALAARARMACDSENEPLTSLPVAVELRSAIDSVASPALEITLAVVWAL